MGALSTLLVIAPPRCVCLRRARRRGKLLRACPAVTRQQFCRRVVVLDAAALHDDDALAQPLDLGHVVRGEQHRGMALAAIAFEMAAHPVGGVGIERGGRLVEQQHVRIVDQRLGERDARLLSGRQAAGRTVEQIGEIELARQLRDAFAQILDAVEHAEHRQVLPHREPHRHFDVGAFEIHAVQDAIALPRHFGAEHGHAAGGRQDEPHDGGDGRGLAGAIAAEEPGDRTGRQRERNAVDGRNRLVDFDEAIDGNRRRWEPGIAHMWRGWPREARGVRQEECAKRSAL